jgi:hypothetical protein
LFYRPFGQPGLSKALTQLSASSGQRRQTGLWREEETTIERVGSGDTALKVSITLEGLIGPLLLPTYINNFTYCNLGVRQNLIYFFSGDIIDMNASNNTDRPSDRFT